MTVPSVNGMGAATSVLCEGDMAIRAGTQMDTARRMDEPQYHSVVNLKDRRAWCWVAGGGRGPCRDDERDRDKQGTHEHQPPRTPPRRRDMGLHERGKGARRRLVARRCDGGGGACD